MSYPSNVGIPSDLDFTLKKAAPRAIRQFRTQLSPIGGLSAGGVTGTDTLKYDIPTGKRGQYLDPSASYLQIRVRAGATGAITLDGSAYCFFSRLTILSGGQTLEDISEYAAFCNAQIDAGVGPTTRQTAFNVMMGTASDISTNNALNIMRAGNTIAANASQVYTLPLISGILGSQGSSKYLPVGAIQNDLRLELVLHQPFNAVINPTTGGTGWNIIEANLMLSYIELDSEVQNMISVTNDEYYISSETWKSYNNNISTAMTSDTILVPAKFASVKGMIHIFRPISGQNNSLVASQSHRYNPFTPASATARCNVQYSIGASLYPNSPMTSSQELFAELQKYYHNLSNSNISGCITNSNYGIIADPATALANGNGVNEINTYFNGTGTGIFGINLDNISNRSDVMTCGINTNNINVIANFTYGTAIPTMLRLDTFVHIDCILAIKGGILTVIV